MHIRHSFTSILTYISVIGQYRLRILITVCTVNKQLQPARNHLLCAPTLQPPAEVIGSLLSYLQGRSFLSPTVAVTDSKILNYWTMLWKRYKPGEDFRGYWLCWERNRERGGERAMLCDRQPRLKCSPVKWWKLFRRHQCVIARTC